MLPAYSILECLEVIRGLGFDGVEICVEKKDWSWVEFDEAVDLIDLGPGEALPADDVGAREGFFAGVIERDGQIVRLLEPAELMMEEEAVQLERVPHTT